MRLFFALITHRGGHTIRHRIEADDYPAALLQVGFAVRSTDDRVVKIEVVEVRDGPADATDEVSFDAPPDTDDIPF